jgi:hypothetical protein
MSASDAAAKDDDDDIMRWQQMNQTLRVDDPSSVARAADREGWRGPDGATDTIVKQALQAAGVSSKAITLL